MECVDGFNVNVWGKCLRANNQGALSFIPLATNGRESIACIIHAPHILPGSRDGFIVSHALYMKTMYRKIHNYGQLSACGIKEKVDS